MGIDTRAAIFVGLPRGQFDSSDLIDSEEIEVCPPHYDGQGEPDAIAGFQLYDSQRYQASEFQWEQARCDELKARFKKLTGQDAKVFISPYVY